MSPLTLPLSYLLWHYTTAWSDLVRLYRNFSWFVWHFFSIRILVGTLFAPWHRLHEVSSKETAGFLGSSIINLILRLIGFLLRIVTIFSGLCTLIALFVCFLFFCIVWLAVPIIIVGLFVQGIKGSIGFFL